MQNIIKTVLNKIEDKGYEAYIIGGFTRDLLLNRTSCDIDIATNATPKTLIEIFPNSKINLGSIAFKKNEYYFEITTYREEIAYRNRRPIKYNYVNSLLTDLQRRDFTINTICLTKNGTFIDLMNGIKDLKNKEIKLIGNPDQKLTEDPLRIMRAIRLATTLDFKIAPSLKKYLLKYSHLILTLSSTRIREELDKILLSSNLKKGLKLLNDFNILKLLKIKYRHITSVPMLEAMYAQITYDYPFNFTRTQKKTIKTIQDILKEGTITTKTIYNHGLYLSLICGQILNIKSSTIHTLAKNMPIKDKKDLKLKSTQIITILNLKNAHNLSTIIKELENLILEGKLINEKEALTNYLLNNQKRWQND